MNDITDIVSQIAFHLIPQLKKILDENVVENIEDKEGVDNIVTNIDYQLDTTIRKYLLDNFECSVLTEETAGEEEIEPGGLIFVVDPLDGTVNFLSGLAHCVSIGVVDEGDACGAVVYLPLENTTYIASKGHGVKYVTDEDLLEGPETAEIRDIVKPAYKRSSVVHTPISFDTPYSREAYDNALRIARTIFGLNGGSLKTYGPTVMDVMKCALGKENRPHDYVCAAFHTEVRSWDLCAVTVILRELGGDIYDIRTGEPLTTESLTSPDEKIAFVASGNETLLNQLYEICHAAFRE